MSAAPSGPMSLDVAMDWVSGRDTGLSSTAIWRHMMGLDPRDRTWGNEVCYPHDPDDFGRCYRLLARIPAWRGGSERWHSTPSGGISPLPGANWRRYGKGKSDLGRR